MTPVSVEIFLFHALCVRINLIPQCGQFFILLYNCAVVVLKQNVSDDTIGK
jgi:hypothetical protein